MTVLGIDPSYKNPAFALIEDGKLVYCKRETPRLKPPWSIAEATKNTIYNIGMPDWVAIEKFAGTFPVAARMMDKSVGIVVGYIYSVYQDEVGLIELTPLDWSKHLGFKGLHGLNLSKEERREMSIEFCSSYYGLTVDHDTAAAICIAIVGSSLIISQETKMLYDMDKPHKPHKLRE